MVNENTIIMILTWLKEKETQAGSRLESEIVKDNKPNHDHFRGREVAYGNARSFIEELTEIKLTEQDNES